MTRRTKAAGAPALALALLLAAGCEPSDVTAPTGSTMSLVASPAAVLIDQDSGETVATTSLVAQLVDAGGLPVTSVPVFFTANGGLLASVDNVCVVNTCSRSGTACSSNTTCPVVPAEGIETDDNGMATDLLTLRLIEDPAQVAVTARAGAITATVTIDKNVNLGPADPKAVFSISPSGGGRTGVPFSLNGTASTFDPEVEPTCFEWQIDSDDDAWDQIARGPLETTLNVIVGDKFDPDQELQIELFVSDEPTIDCPTFSCVGAACSADNPPDPDLFSLFSESKNYSVKCDPTPPDLDAGANQTITKGGQATVTVTVTPEVVDPENTPPADFTYSWTCGNGGEGGNAKTVQCHYDGLGTFVIEYRVTNECGLFDDDDVVVQINP
jgi:hypothetical protein